MNFPTTKAGLKKGDRVQLILNVAQTFERNRRSGVSWVNRKGTVDRTYRGLVTVRWDGRQSIDLLPIKAVRSFHE